MTDKSAPLETGGLPELPEPAQVSYVTDSVMRSYEVRSFNADQMRAYAASAVLASRVAPQEPDAWVTPMLYGSKVTFYKPSKPDNWYDGDDGREWYCRPLYAAPARPAALVEPAGELAQEELVALERERCATICDDFEYMMNQGAGSGVGDSYGDRFNQAARKIRSGELPISVKYPPLAAPAVAVDPLVAEIETETSVHQVESASLAAPLNATITDAQRLDWLQEHGSDIVNGLSTELPFTLFWYDSEGNKDFEQSESLRAAIDAAIKANEGGAT